MATIGAPAGTTARVPLSLASKVTVGGLVAHALVMGVWLQGLLIMAAMPPVGLIQAVIALAFAVPIMLSQARWVPLLGAAFAVATVTANFGAIVSDLRGPASGVVFVVGALVTVAVAFGAGVWATVLDYRK